METKYFKVKKATIQRTNNGGYGSEVGEIYNDNVWDNTRFIPKKGMDFNADDLLDLALLMKKMKK